MWGLRRAGTDVIRRSPYDWQWAQLQRQSLGQAYSGDPDIRCRKTPRFRAVEEMVRSKGLRKLRIFRHFGSIELFNIEFYNFSLENLESKNLKNRRSRVRCLDNQQDSESQIST